MIHRVPVSQLCLCERGLANRIKLAKNKNLARLAKAGLDIPSPVVRIGKEVKLVERGMLKKLLPERH